MESRKIVLLEPPKPPLQIALKSKNLLIIKEMAIIGLKVNVCPKQKEFTATWMQTTLISISIKVGNGM